jgi:hypothetical protein
MNDYFNSIHNEVFEKELLNNLKNNKKFPLPTTYAERIYLSSILEKIEAKSFFTEKEIEAIKRNLDTSKSKKKSSLNTPSDHPYLIEKKYIKKPLCSKFIEPILKSLLNYKKLLIKTVKNSSLELIPYSLDFDNLDQEFYLIAYNLATNTLFNNFKLNNIIELTLVDIEYSKYISYQNMIAKKLKTATNCNCLIILQKKHLPERNRILLLLSPYKRIISELDDGSLEINLFYNKKDENILIMKLLTLGSYIIINEKSNLYEKYISKIKNAIKNYL